MKVKQLTNERIKELFAQYIDYEEYDEGEYGKEVDFIGVVEFGRALEAELLNQPIKYEFQPYKVEVSETMWKFIQSQKKRVK
jgi:hypothetical protein